MINSTDISLSIIADQYDVLTKSLSFGDMFMARVEIFSAGPGIIKGCRNHYDSAEDLTGALSIPGFDLFSIIGGLLGGPYGY